MDNALCYLVVSATVHQMPVLPWDPREVGIRMAAILAGNYNSQSFL